MFHMRSTGAFLLLLLVDSVRAGSWSSSAQSDSSSDSIECNEDGFFRDPDDCSVFFRCSHGKGYRFECPGGLMFDMTLNVCNWPSSVDCSTSDPATNNYDPDYDYSPPDEPDYPYAPPPSYKPSYTPEPKPQPTYTQKPTYKPRPRKPISIPQAQPKPTSRPQQQMYQPMQPNYQQQQPNYQPRQPMYQQQQTMQQMQPQRPMMQPQRPMMQPQRPMMQPQRPMMQPQRPMMQQQRPMMQPQRPMMQQQRPMMQPQRPMMQPQRPMMQPQRPIMQPQRPIMQPQRPMMQPQRPMMQPQKPVYNKPQYKQQYRPQQKKQFTQQKMYAQQPMNFGMNNMGMMGMNNGLMGRNNGLMGRNNGLMGRSNGMMGRNNGLMGMNNGMMGRNNGMMGRNNGIMGGMFGGFGRKPYYKNQNQNNIMGNGMMGNGMLGNGMMGNGFMNNGMFSNMMGGGMGQTTLFPPYIPQKPKANSLLAMLMQLQQQGKKSGQMSPIIIPYPMPPEWFHTKPETTTDPMSTTENPTTPSNIAGKKGTNIFFISMVPPMFPPPFPGGPMDLGPCGADPFNISDTSPPCGAIRSLLASSQGTRNLFGNALPSANFPSRTIGRQGANCRAISSGRTEQLEINFVGSSTRISAPQCTAFDNLINSFITTYLERAIVTDSTRSTEPCTIAVPDIDVVCR